ncbi:NAD(P)/FAD-dependent oxidoreductase [Kibdelosporangium phytohabitans]|uniref:Thioredoxin reductase n=1 Tax=Kibdelosporangium phytohabitans TaxID=860235 RepID=A0A0N9HZC0_9PSEU|nr:NAD(P)/FAD-dependent oxidoreductase [Kibdelosporangium phytohabitans]ALG11075.1 thioredoxin reductase [Kibdelosporangium phytohabitans]MBE1462316.1 thioredoxin reductase [Kibdelosporangium phytohabitans]
MTTYDVVVVGAGAAGLSAALVLTRARRSVAVVDSGQPRNAPAAHSHGYLTRDGVPPGELLELGRMEVTGYGGEFFSGEVTAIHRGFTVDLADGTKLKARSVVVATGLRDELPDVPGVAERWGKEVIACPYCHGYEFADRPIGVLHDAHHALLLRQWSSDIVFFAASADIPERAKLAARGIRIIETGVRGLVIEGDRLVGVELVDGRCVPTEAVFLRPKFVPRDEVLKPLGYDPELTEAFGRTNVPGLWVAGNVGNPMANLISSAGEGSSTAAMVNLALVQADVEQAMSFSHEQERDARDMRHRDDTSDLRV